MPIPPVKSETAGVSPSASGPRDAVAAVEPLRILLASDGSAHAEAAARVLSLLRLPPGTAVRVLVVTPDSGRNTPEWVRVNERDWAARLAERAAEELARPEVEVSSEISAGAAAREVLEAADAFRATLVVLGSRGRTGLEAMLLGSVSRNVAHHARQPVLVARPPRQDMESVVLAVDESEYALRAVEFLARTRLLPPETEVLVAHAAPPYDPFPGIAPDDPDGFRREVRAEQERRRKAAEQLVGRAAQGLQNSGSRVRTVVADGQPAAEILRLAAESSADLVVMGARGSSLIERLLVGSVADRVLRAAPCSVLLVR